MQQERQNVPSTNFSPPNLPRKSGRSLAWCIAPAIAGLLTLGACASDDHAPTEALQAAELAIAAADQSKAAEFAAPELKDARDKLAAARTEVQEEHMERAKRLAEQSRADAELASAKAEAAKAKAVNDEMQKSTESLKQEMQRNTGAGR